jgi:hypothetical protein
MTRQEHWPAEDADFNADKNPISKPIPTTPNPEQSTLNDWG